MPKATKTKAASRRPAQEVIWDDEPFSERDREAIDASRRDFATGNYESLVDARDDVEGLPVEQR